MKISETIIEEGIDKVEAFKKRTTVRGIIINKNKEILMLYSKEFDDYTFPGGGMKEDEDKEEALKRELNEEIGAKDIKVIKYIGYMEEIRYGISGSNNLYKQTSFYYLVEIGSFGKPKLVGREKEQGITPKWTTISAAIRHNKHIHNIERNNKKGLKTVLIRENEVLRFLEEKIDERF